MKLGQLGILTLATALVVQAPLQVHAASVSKSEEKVVTNNKIGAEAETAAPITVNHVYNGTIFKTETLTGTVGETYTSEDLISAGAKNGKNSWRLTNTTGNPIGTFSTEPQTVTYEYTPFKNAMNIQVLYKDIDTGKGIYVHNPFDPDQLKQGLKSFDNITGSVGDTIDFSYQQTYVGMDEGYQYADGTIGTGGSYEFVKESPALPSIMPATYPGEDRPVVTLYYKKISDENPVVAGQDVTVKYVDTDGNELAPADILSGNIDESYTSKAKTIDGYTLKETPANATGTFSDAAQTVTYVYEKDAVAGEDVIVKYVDTDGNELAVAETLKGNIGEAFAAKEKAIDGYTLKETPVNATGTFSDTAQTVTYVYEKDAVVVAGQDVTVKYVDADGNEVATTDTLSGNVGDDYISKAKTIDGYTLKETPANATGTFSDASQTVTYVYEKDAVVVAGQDVTVKYVDADGNELATSATLSGNVGDAYASKAKTIDGYTLKETPANATGTFSNAAQTVTYVYEKKSADNNNHKNGTTDKNTPTTNMNVQEKNTVKDPTSNNSAKVATSKTGLPKTGDQTLDSGILVGIGALLLGVLALFTRRQKNAK
ncbi:MucBP domain-containing protein [Listeria fleischmannii]|uniref:Internalin-J n=1 Tax=Listeria fleischmannii subsp. fleischmannii TaxID=1671902 RepID=A0A2X3HHA7_9LIST|nr:MucBP domain-containing protein [Listeria fleischmannii]EMG27698.1 hypothetical protein LFLEISCH_09614 [Listeria fleischmannii subsp. fleischmannii LU2006-1]SQC72017.1 Internalin-J precursor [Listeria fleischmannii subsp. fleischmannii]